MAKWASGESATATEHKIEEFAEDLGGLLGTARAKAESWLGQRQEIVQHLSEIRDTATKLLADLGQHAQEVVHRRRRGHPPGSHHHKVTVVDIDDTASVLRTRREALRGQLDAVDRALAAPTAAGIIHPNAQELHTAKPAEEATSSVVPTRVKPRRVLSDEHRHALAEGRRKARHAKDAAAGRARETFDPAPGLAPASTATDLPRLVKRHTPGSGRQ
jgi:hypothetical protein